MNTLNNLMETPPIMHPGMLGVAPSKYTLQIPADAEKDIKALAGKRVEDMTQQELRVMYFFIQGTYSERLYSSSDVKSIQETGGLLKDSGSYMSESLFIGDQVHKAVELEGTNIKKLRCYEEIGEEPVTPVFDDLTSSLHEMVAHMATGSSDVRAYWLVRDNQQTKCVTEETIKDYEKDESQITPELKKLLAKVKSETVKITKQHIEDYTKYLDKLGTFNKRKAAMLRPGDIIVDELPFKKSKASTIIFKIKAAYEALSTHSQSMAYYSSGVTKKRGGLHRICNPLAIDTPIW